MRNNSVQLIGYVGGSPSIYRSADGSKRAVFRVATHHERQRGKSGAFYQTTWHTVVAWDGTADYAERSFLRGSQILVEGILCQRRFVDIDGKMRQIVDVKAHYLRNLDR